MSTYDRLPSDIRPATDQCADSFWSDNYDFAFSGKRFESYYTEDSKHEFFPPISYRENPPTYIREFLDKDGVMIKNDW